MTRRSLWRRADVLLASLVTLATLTAGIVLALTLFQVGLEPVLALVVTVCSRTFSETLAHQAGLGRLFLLLSLAIGLTLATVEAFRLLSTTQRWTTSLVPLQRPANRRLRRLLRKCHLAQPNAVLVQATSPLVFTHGLIRPKVWLSTGLMRILTDDELEAVLRHEAYHLKVYDPLRILLASCLSRALFFAPAARDLSDAYALAKEIAADSHATRAMGDALPLARALRKLITARPALGLTASLVGEMSVTEARLLALLNPARPFPALPLKHLGVSLLWLLVFIAVTLMPAAGHAPSFTECAISSVFGVWLL